MATPIRKSNKNKSFQELLELFYEQVCDDKPYDAQSSLKCLCEALERNRELDVEKMILEADEAAAGADKDEDEDEVPEDEALEKNDELTQNDFEEMADELSNLNNTLNRAKIQKLYNIIATLRSQLGTMSFDDSPLKQVEFETKLSFYSEVLEKIQHQSMPGIERRPAGQDRA